MNNNKLKEDIATRRSLLNYIVALLIGAGAGTIKFYLNQDFNVLFYVGLLSLIILVVSFILTWNQIYEKIEKLEEV